ncbi:MAG: hypothetical protein F4X11_00900 [Acidobacteria bacterium]|nr:hypothetical protein [Chloroflexota bacterium]MYN63582.1 hypothetical protein [Acidobacteriota bacterium]
MPDGLELGAADAAGRLQQQRPHLPGAGLRGAAQRAHPQRAHHPDRPAAWRHPAVGGRLARPLGRRHAGRRDDEFRALDQLRRVLPRHLPGRAVHAPRPRHGDVRVHFRRSEQPDAAVQRRHPVPAHGRRALRVRLPRGQLRPDRHPRRRAAQEHAEGDVAPVAVVLPAIVETAGASSSRPFPSSPHGPDAVLVEWIGVPLTIGPPDDPQVWTHTASNLISILLILAVTTFYSTTGGLRSVVATDVLQLAVMLAGTAAFAAVVVAEIGGLGAVAERLQDLFGGGGPGGIRPEQILAFTLGVTNVNYDMRDPIAGSRNPR